MRFTELSLPGAFVIDIEARADERGLFARTFCEHEFAELGLETAIVQESISFNQKRGTVRGMHYQTAPHGETKTVRCTAGAVYDVIVDIRDGSPTFGKCATVELSAANRRTIYIPAGFAHGFQTLVDGTELLYQMSTEYVAESARGVRWDDKALEIAWPILQGVTISGRDAELPSLDAIRAE